MSSSISSSVYVESAMNTVSYCSIRSTPLILACAFAGSVPPRPVEAVHRTQRSRHQGLAPENLQTTHQRASLPLDVRPAPAPGNLLGDEISDVVTRRRVFLFRVAEAHQDLHLEALSCTAYFFPSGFL